MTVPFRIDSVSIETTAGPVSYTFKSDVTVLTGPTGVGKTTLLELIKFALGGEARLATVVEEFVNAVSISLRIGDRRLKLSRSTSATKAKTVQVQDVAIGESLGEHAIGGKGLTVSSLLLECMDLPTDLRAAPQGPQSSSVGALITFADIFRFMYIPQYEINGDIAGSQEPYYAPKRRAVWELIFSLRTAWMFRTQERINGLKEEIDKAENNAAVVANFLINAGIEARQDAVTKREEARSNLAESERALNHLRSELADVVDTESQVIRDLLAAAEVSLAEAQRQDVELRRLLREYKGERHRVSQDIERLARIKSAGFLLAEIEFIFCPRCTQRLDQRTAERGLCPVCAQPDVISKSRSDDQYESTQLASQLDEVDALLILIRRQQEQTAQAVVARKKLVLSLSRDLDSRTSSRITPRLQLYTDTTKRIEQAKAQIANCDGVILQWDNADKLLSVANDLKAQRKDLQGELDDIQRALVPKRAKVTRKLSQTFAETIGELGIPGITTASINPQSGLPTLNGKPFSKYRLGGGVTTALQVAYWITLIKVAVREGGTYYPTFLMIDSPRLALKSGESMANQMYELFQDQVGVKGGRLQIIIVDNDVPLGVKHRFKQTTFSYESPTISTIVHPGPSSVNTIDTGHSADSVSDVIEPGDDEVQPPESLIAYEQPFLV